MTSNEDHAARVDESNDELIESFIEVDLPDTAFEDWEQVNHVDLLDRYSQTRRPPWQLLPSPRHIRILKLYPPHSVKASAHSDLIRCTFEIVNLDVAKAKYEALSYAWGPSKRGQELIVCNGVRVLIQRNLHRALENLRHNMTANQIRRVWVDALCIDQFNPAERGQQVSMMKDIFAFASRVLIWLGEADRASHEVMSATKFLRDLAFKNSTSIKAIFKYGLASPKMREDFIDRAWFQRVWTLQEAIRATRATMICGEDELEWSDFCTIWTERYENFKAHRKLGSEDRSNINESVSFVGLINCIDMQTRYRNRGSEVVATIQKLPLSEVLIRSWYRDAAEHRDRVYAILGLLDETQYPDLEPDYSVPELELFLKVTKLAMRVDRTPALLHLAGLSPSTSNSPSDEAGNVREVNSPVIRPSWIPDWTIRGRQNTWLCLLMASSDSAARIDSRPGRTGYDLWTPEFENDKLKLRGCVLGQISCRSVTNDDSVGARDAEIKCLNPFYYGQCRTSNPDTSGATSTLTLKDRPYDGETLRDNDLICVFTHCMTLFLVRPLREVDLNTEYDFEWFKEDYANNFMSFPCQLVGPCTVPGLELPENASDGPDCFLLH